MISFVETNSFFGRIFLVFRDLFLMISFLQKKNTCSLFEDLTSALILNKSTIGLS